MTCPRCLDAGTVLVPILPLDPFGVPQDLVEAPCGCQRGDEEAVRRIGRPAPPVDREDFLRDIDALSRAALAPAPSPRTETALGGPTVSHRGDADADAEGRPASAVDSQSSLADHAFSPVPVVPESSEAAASAAPPPGRRSNLQHRKAA